MNKGRKPLGMIGPSLSKNIIDISAYNKAALSYFKDIVNKGENLMDAVEPSAPQAAAHPKAAALLQQHSLNIKGSERSQKSDKALKLKETEGPAGEVNISPALLFVIVAGVALVVALMVSWIMRSQDRDYHKFLGERSGLSTSSSDVTSSETGSTDRELKSRMERFERRLEEHKRMLEENDPVDETEPNAPSSGSNGNGTGGSPPPPVKLTWMQKQ